MCTPYDFFIWSEIHTSCSNWIDTPLLDFLHLVEFENSTAKQ